MIITVTFNPAIDKTAQVDTLQLGGLNRLENVLQDAGGKGVNVSKTIHALGGISLCTGFLAGASGQFIEQTLTDLGIDQDFVWVDGMTRTNLKVLDKDRELTELNEAGPSVTKQQVDKLMQTILSHCKEECYVVLSGNVSLGVDHHIYQEMIQNIKAIGGKVIFDADGDLFAHGIKARPMVIKPNKYELATYFHVSEQISNKEIISLAKTLVNEETQLVVISMGKEGSIFITKDEVYQAEALSVTAYSSVGAGDAMVAGIAYALEKKYALEKLMTLAVAASAGAVLSKGTQPAEFAMIKELEQQVKIHKLEEK